jgi:hypothetical protein
MAGDVVRVARAWRGAATSGESSARSGDERRELGDELGDESSTMSLQLSSLTETSSCNINM